MKGENICCILLYTCRECREGRHLSLSRCEEKKEGGMQLVGLTPQPRFYGSAGVFIFCTRRRPAAATDYPFAVLSRHCVISVLRMYAPSMAWVPGLCSYFWPGRSKDWGADHLFLQPWQGTLSRKGTLCSTWKKLMCSRRPLSSPSPRMSFPSPIIALLY